MSPERALSHRASVMANARIQRLPAAVAWVGTAVAVLAGPTHVLLAHDGHVGVVVPVAGVLASAAGLWLVRTLWRSPPSRSAA